MSDAAPKAKAVQVHDAGEKTQDVTPKKVETEHKEEVLTGDLGQKAAQALRIIQEKQALVGTTLGTVGGALTGDKGKRLRSTARGFAKGLGTDVGMGSGALLGGGLGGIAGGLATLPLAGIGAIPGAALGALGGGAAGGRMGYGITSSLLGPYKSDDEKFQEQMARFLAAQKQTPAADTGADKEPGSSKKEKTDASEKKQAGYVEDTLRQSADGLRGANAGGLAGLAGGGLLGALHGAYDPGATAALDENGKPVAKRRSRLMGALRGGVRGAAIGGLAGRFGGHALGQYMGKTLPANAKMAAFNFGVKMSEGAPAMPFTREGYNQLAAASGAGALGLYGGTAAGAGLGALHGLISPGEIVGRDANGQPIVKKRNRIVGALRGGLAGGAAGGMGGMALGMGGGALTEKLRPGTLGQLMPEAQKRLTAMYDHLSTAK